MVPKRYEGKQRDYNTEIPIGKTDLPRVCGSGYDIGTQWRRIERIGGAELDFRFRSYVDVGK